MRITQNMLHTGALARHQQNLRQIEVAQQRVGTGLRILKASDDPAGTSAVMQTNSSLRALEQYHRNIQASRTRVDAEESSLQQLGDVIVRAKELALAQAGDTADGGSRAIANAELKQLLHFAVGLANTQVSGSYIFGGASASLRPVEWSNPEGSAPTVTLDPLNPGHHQVEISAGAFVQTTSNAVDVFNDGGIFAALWDLSQALGANDPEAIRSSITGLDTGFQHVQTLIGDAGARATQLQVTAANLNALEINLRTLKSDLEEADFEKAVTELVSRQTAFQAAMLATSRVMGLTLADYLR